MSTNRREKAKRSYIRSKKQTQSVPPVNLSPGGMPSMFDHVQSIVITGGSFTNVNTANVIPAPSLDILYKHVAPNAILNVGGRADPVRCHPGTREEVIRRIERWGDGQDGSTSPIFWLSGPAGAGKSAIVQTVAERCNQRGVPHANFFFFREDSSRSNASPLIATILHQIVLLYPSLRDPVATLLTTNPLIFNSTLDNQLMQLLVVPLHSLQKSSSDFRPIVLMVDGLDECNSETKHSQQQILHAFDKVLVDRPCPFRLLVASRDESHIQAAFNTLSSDCFRLYLDDKYSPESDIRVFVNAQFKQVRHAHPLAHTLDVMWPSAKDVNYIVEKSSGQFIYAATVMRFISASSASPMLSLERVKGAARLATKSPFSHLDAIYTYILSQVDDQEALKEILHAQLLLNKLNGKKNIVSERGVSPIGLIELFKWYNPKYSQAVVLSCLADLTPIIWLPSRSPNLLFHHASFPDYLLDQSRSGDYFVDTVEFNHKVLPTVWQQIKRRKSPKKWIQFGIRGITQMQKGSPGFMNTLASTKGVWNCLSSDNKNFFCSMYNLCVSDEDIIPFRQILCQWLKPFNNFFVLNLYKIGDIPFGQRYLQMAWANQFYRLNDEMAAALCPETDFDRSELTQWLNGLLHDMHSKMYNNRLKDYIQFLEEWISWAVRNNIACDGLHDLPNAQEYIRKSIDEKRATQVQIDGGGD